MANVRGKSCSASWFTGNAGKLGEKTPHTRQTAGAARLTSCVRKDVEPPDPPAAAGRTAHHYHSGEPASSFFLSFFF